MLLTVLKLVRAPNVFTAIADVVMGYLVVTQGLGSIWPLLLLVLASACLYSAGMALNDVFDIKDDSELRPDRPIPSGQISLQAATRIGVGLLLAGAVLGGLVGFVTTSAAYPWRSSVIVAALVVCIVLYDGVLKRTFIAPWLMGGCRFFNILLGMSVANTGNDQQMWLLGYRPVQLLIAASIGVYIAGVTWFARTEAKPSNRSVLIFGFGTMMAGVILLMGFPRIYNGELLFRNHSIWPMLMLLLAVTVARRCILAIISLEPKPVQTAVKQSILSLILFDAAICLAVAGVPWGIGVVALLAPTTSLGKWIYST